MKIGFLGFGEAAFEMSCGLKREGVNEISVYDILHDHPDYAELIASRVKKAGVKSLFSPKEIVENSDLIIAAVPANKALELSADIEHLLNNGVLYIDVSASDPEVKKQIADTVEQTGALFVDAQMMGPLPTYKHKVPIVASGTGTDKFIEIMSKYGMNIKKVSDVPGEASSIKLIRSVYMKGMSALLLEVLQAAQKFNVEDLVIASLAESLDGKSFEHTLNRLVTATAIHAERRSYELEGAIKLLQSIDVEPIMSQGTKDKLIWMAGKNLKTKFGGQTPNNYKEVLTEWS